MKSIRNENGEAVGSVIHAFELAGLGKAPFQYVGMNENLHVPYPGAPVEACKPGGTCAYCGNGILYEFIIRSSDGKQFKVGSDCVRKVDEGGLRKVIDRKVAEMRRVANIKRQDARIARAKALLPSVEAKLAAIPHPNKDRAARGESKLSCILWYLANAGRSGQSWAAKVIEEAAA